MIKKKVSFQVTENSYKTKNIPQWNQSRQRFITQFLLYLALGGKKDSYRIMQWPFSNLLFPEYSQKMRGQEEQTTLRNSRVIMFWHKWKYSGNGSINTIFPQQMWLHIFIWAKEIILEKDWEFNKYFRTKSHNLIDTNESHTSCFPFILFISAHTHDPVHFSLIKIRDPI